MPSKKAMKAKAMKVKKGGDRSGPSGQHRDTEYLREINKLKRALKKRERENTQLMERYKERNRAYEYEELAELTCCFSRFNFLSRKT